MKSMKKPMKIKKIQEINNYENMQIEQATEIILRYFILGHLKELFIFHQETLTCIHICLLPMLILPCRDSTNIRFLIILLPITTNA